MTRVKLTFYKILKRSDKMTTEIILISIDVFVEEHQIPCDGCGECAEYGRLCRCRGQPIKI